MSWTNYEVTVPVTIHARYIPYFGIGIITGWQGHTASPCQVLSSGSWVTATNCQPNYGHPFYGLAWWINQYYNSYTTEEIYANSPSYDETPLIDTPRVLTLGTPYMFKFSVQRNSPNGTHTGSKSGRSVLPNLPRGMRWWTTAIQPSAQSYWEHFRAM